MTSSKKIFIVLLIVSLLQALLYYTALPERLASHFDGSGRPNGWSSKAVFFAIVFSMIGLVALSFLYLPAVQFRISFNFWSLPHKDYWLAPERREKTLRRIQDQMLWFGVATLVLLIITTQFVIDANLKPQPRLPSAFLWIFLAYLAYTFVWTVGFIRRFARVPGGAPENDIATARRPGRPAG
jgi:serine/threonine-protein kinase